MAFFKVTLKVARKIVLCERFIPRHPLQTFSDERSFSRHPSRTFSRERSLANEFLANIPSRMFPHKRSLNYEEL